MYTKNYESERVSNQVVEIEAIIQNKYTLDIKQQMVSLNSKYDKAIDKCVLLNTIKQKLQDLRLIYKQVIQKELQC